MRFQKILIKDCRRLPIRAVDGQNRQEIKLRSDLVAAVRRLMSMRSELADARTAREITVIERQVTTVDREIDGLVYQLYGLDASEIVAVENVFVVTNKESISAATED
jgi:hypothetical protein